MDLLENIKDLDLVASRFMHCMQRHKPQVFNGKDILQSIDYAAIHVHLAKKTFIDR